MTSNPPQPARGWPATWPASSGSAEAVPAAQHPGAGAAPAAPAGPRDKRLAMAGYLGVPFLGPCVPLLIYLLSRRKPGFVRRHAVQALNLSVTALLYGICVLIAGAMLALDSITVAVAVVVPLAACLWLVTLGYVIVAARSAGHGGFRRIPARLCATVVR